MKTIYPSLICIVVVAVAISANDYLGSNSSSKSDAPPAATKDSSKNKSAAENNYKPQEGYVPDTETAIAIAVAVWNPIYGKKQIEEEKPYKANLSNGVWTVEGSLPEGNEGGVALAEISKDDGRVLRVIHGK